MEELLLSLCIPTNGVIEWVLPVLESIYEQKVDEKKFEVVVSDNGDNAFFAKKMKEYCDKYPNIIYIKNNSVGFLNQIESFRHAHGKFIKFINHRMKLKEDALLELLSFIEQNLEQKPIVFFSNGKLKLGQCINDFRTFDDFVYNLTYWSSWSAGLGIWKEDFERMPQDLEYSILFPHTTILFHEKKRERYIIHNGILLEEILTEEVQKGRYDLFKAFAVDYLIILGGLLSAEDISSRTFMKIKKDNLDFIAWLYCEFVVFRKRCSYDLSGYKDSIEVFYSDKAVKRKLPCIILKKIFSKLTRKL